MQTQYKHDPETHAFEHQATAVSLRVRQSLAAACIHLGFDATSPRLLARQTGWNKNLAWKISRVVTDDNLLAATPLLPGRSGQLRIVQTLLDAGAPIILVEEIRSALLEFESMVLTHAGDRDTFEKMLGDLTHVGQADRDEAHRKQAFEGNSAFWGIEARVRLSCNVICPSDDDERLDVSSMSGVVDFRRLRSDTAWTLGSTAATDDTGELHHSPAEIALETGERISPGVPPIVRQFSEGVPPLQCVPGRDHQTLYRIASGAVGNPGLFTCMFGRTHRAVMPRWRTPVDRSHEFSVEIYTPFEMVYFDLFVHKSLREALRPRLSLISVLPGGPTMPTGSNRNEWLLRDETPLPIPTEPLDVTAPDVPNYPRMANWLFERLRANPAEYQGFRFRQRYPMLSTKASYFYELPDRP